MSQAEFEEYIKQVRFNTKKQFRSSVSFYDDKEMF